MWNMKQEKKMNKPNQTKQTCRYRQQNSVCQKETRVKVRKMGKVSEVYGGRRKLHFRV